LKRKNDPQHLLTNETYKRCTEWENQGKISEKEETQSKVNSLIIIYVNSFSFNSI